MSHVAYGLVVNFSIEAAGLLCDFHRAQSWSRWLKKNKVGQKGAVFNQLQKLASSLTEADFDAGLDALQRSDVWSAIGQYITTIWLSCKQVLFYIYNCQTDSLNALY
ncbi:hypothetical protein DPMN_082877 [Dreissena polymorpha]|uniref:Uncharacterized protein n=1 Tax=Dreissena polymorpha TaxID=45954 RepID=A0A9D3Y7R8_DREPO|nr:hypothetical protein DPMN_082877 [Dreissena polymorpha]